MAGAPLYNTTATLIYCLGQVQGGRTDLGYSPYIKELNRDAFLCLFNLHIDDLRPCLPREACHFPYLSKYEIPILLYANYAMIMFRSVMELANCF